MQAFQLKGGRLPNSVPHLTVLCCDWLGVPPSSVERSGQKAEWNGALGTMYFYRGDPRTALKQYRNAPELAPGSSKVRSNLGLLCHKTGRNSEASGEFRRAPALDPNNQEAVNDLREIVQALE